ncbi:MAG: EF-P 5-aminopentanol modification-associated protein YfmH [Eubacteriales bacterium]|jgi:predicted Zn-dependent peptidase
MSEVRWFESPTLGERYCKITSPGRPVIYVFPKDLINTYALVAVKYGSIDRKFKPDGKADFIEVPDGVAHFLEHRMFTDEEGNDIFERFAALGADANAYTSYDRTVYYFNCTENFKEAFGVLLHMVAHPCFTDEQVTREQAIIAQEIRMYDDEPEDVCYQNLLAAMYHVHPVRVNICGTVTSIAEITPELLYDCHRTFYSAGNMVIIVCGRVDPGRVAEIVEANIPVSEAAGPLRFVYEEPAEVISRRITARRQVSKPVFAIGIKNTDISPDPVARLREHLLQRVLTRMIFAASGELYNSLYDKEIITAPFAYSYDSAPSGSYSHVIITGSAEDPDKVFERTVEYIAALCGRGIDKADFERCRRVVLSRMVGRFDSTERIANAMIASAFRGIDIFEEKKVLEGLTGEDAEMLLRKFYKEDRFVLSVVLPTGDAPDTNRRKDNENK